MSETDSGTSPFVIPPEDRLDSWKEIAAYLNRDVATVQRWEKREGMPVHRHLHNKAGSVYASRTELDEWTRSRTVRAAQECEDSAPSTSLAPPLPATPETSNLRPWRRLLPIGAGIATLAIAAVFWLRSTEYFWRNPIANARVQTVTDFDGVEQAAAVSRDGQFVAFLSDRDGQVDVWVTHIGSGQFHNLTRGSVRELVNPSVRSLGFSPDGSLVTFWAREADASEGGDISIWAVPTLGGQPKVYLEGVAEFEWSGDGSRLAYHTPEPGDPLFVSDGRLPAAQRIFVAPAGQHVHFPSWAPDAQFLYFVQGFLPNQLDIWRIPPTGGTPERITSHNGLVSHPILLDRRTLLYLATDSDGSGPWLHGMDVRRRIPHRLSFSQERYTSLAASAGGRRLVATVATPIGTLWRMRMTDSSQPAKIPLTTRAGFAPRLGPDYLVYVSPTGTGESIWKLASGTAMELWNGRGARIFGGPAISTDGRYIAFSVVHEGQKLLYAMRSDGTKARVLADSLDLEGAPAWAPDGQSITTAARDRGVPRLFRVPTNGRPPISLTQEYSINPAWAPDGRFLVYSGADIGTTFPVKAISPEGASWSLRPLVLTRGARHLVLAGGRELVILRGEIGHKNLWLIDLETGAERQLTNFPFDFAIRDFDVSPDGRELVLERVQEHSDVVLLDVSKTR
jgi:Tol biopolymer transport system component